MPRQYQHLFFDLDRTLWDFDKSSLEAFEEIFKKHQLAQKELTIRKNFTKNTVHIIESCGIFTAREFWKRISSDGNVFT